MTESVAARFHPSRRGFGARASLGVFPVGSDLLSVAIGPSCLPGFLFAELAASLHARIRHLLEHLHWRATEFRGFSVKGRPSRPERRRTRESLRIENSRINFSLRKKAAANMNSPHFPRRPSRSGPWRARNSGHIRNVGSDRQAPTSTPSCYRAGSRWSGGWKYRVASPSNSAPSHQPPAPMERSMDATPIVRSGGRLRRIMNFQESSSMRSSTTAVSPAPSITSPSTFPTAVDMRSRRFPTLA